MCGHVWTDAEDDDDGLHQCTAHWERTHTCHCGQWLIVAGRDHDAAEQGGPHESHRP